MTIIKSCKPEHNISRAKAIQLGTIYHYATLDNKFIGDPTEGFSVHIVKPTERLEIDGALLKPFVPQLTVGKVILGPGSTFEFSYTIPNTFIFCCSQIDGASQFVSYSLGYDDYYEIVDLDSFMNEVDHGLREHIKSTKWEVGDYTLYKIASPVQYQKSRILNYTDFSPEDILLDTLFSKLETSSLDPSVRFSDNKEFRLAWVMQDSDNFYWHPPKYPVHIPVTRRMKAACRWK